MISTEESTQQLLRKFNEIEEQPPKALCSQDEQIAATWYTNRTKQDSMGKYVLRLPFKEEAQPALKRRDSAANDELCQQYTAFMKKYLRLSHMRFPRRISVRYAKSTTTKLRVVFNASQTTPTGKSLNDLYVIAADIEKMYRQIGIYEKDQDFQPILWRNHPSETLKHYKLTTATYEKDSACYERLNFPKTYQVLEEGFYVHDLSSGDATIEGVSQQQQNLITSPSSDL
ncbi:uncharacterized protein LOC119654039 [Hermetia illucens]|uniref:uncharacterized protein LOC119654039 n=1 Tax=Hermetia illucens TaxID=343691 RepID=UPI0018CBF3AE|nr:uncharacterized protein LOC119654039 [Hermetia illucens]